MKVAICDDDKFFTDDVRRHIEFFAHDNCVDFEIDVYSDPKELFDNSEIYSIAILDVEMPQINGITLGEELRRRNKRVALMYVTAHACYLDEALDLNAARFFEKPLDSKRFYIGLKRVIEKIDNTLVTVFLDGGNSKKIISAEDIIFVEIKDRKTHIVTEKEEFYSKSRMKFWKERLISSCFASPHKSYIINMNCISEYNKKDLVLCSRYRIPIARNNQSVFRKRFVNFMEG